jgi:hypothetical protein
MNKNFWLILVFGFGTIGTLWAPQTKRVKRGRGYCKSHNDEELNDDGERWTDKKLRNIGKEINREVSKEYNISRKSHNRLFERAMVFKGVPGLPNDIICNQILIHDKLNAARNWRESEDRAGMLLSEKLRCGTKRDLAAEGISISYFDACQKKEFLASLPGLEEVEFLPDNGIGTSQVEGVAGFCESFSHLKKITLNSPSECLGERIEEFFAPLIASNSLETLIISDNYFSGDRRYDLGSSDSPDFSSEIERILVCVGQIKSLKRLELYDIFKELDSDSSIQKIHNALFNIKNLKNLWKLIICDYRDNINEYDHPHDIKFVEMIASSLTKLEILGLSYGVEEEEEMLDAFKKMKLKKLYFGEAPSIDLLRDLLQNMFTLRAISVDYEGCGRREDSNYEDAISEFGFVHEGNSIFDRPQKLWIKKSSVDDLLV